MPQNARLQIGMAAKRIHQPTFRILRYRIDGQVAAFEILLDGDRGLGMKGKTAIARRGLALGARQGVLLATVGVDEYREVLADGAVACGLHLFRPRADHDIVAVRRRLAQQLVAHRATNQIHIHADIVAWRARAGTLPGAGLAR